MKYCFQKIIGLSIILAVISTISYGGGEFEDTVTAPSETEYKLGLYDGDVLLKTNTFIIEFNLHQDSNCREVNRL